MRLNDTAGGFVAVDPLVRRLKCPVVGQLILVSD